MAHTYTQIHIQLVFAVKYRKRVLDKAWRAELFMYITGIIKNHGHKLLSINGIEDHVHILIGMRPVEALSTLVQEVKKSSSKWINDQHRAPRSFRWQEGFSAFSYSMDALPNVIRYIENQEEHHRKKTFKEEYVAMLKEFEIDFDDRYIFEELS
jgi:REP element-mobilizing transposase RayT